ncbi:MAG: hypothetical protein ACREAB_06015, partial [Blastocatellia bacterium]
VFFQVKDIAFDFGHLTADRNSLAANLDFLTQAAFKKIPHCYYSSTNLILGRLFNLKRAALISASCGVFQVVKKEARLLGFMRLRFYSIVLPIRNLIEA